MAHDKALHPWSLIHMNRFVSYYAHMLYCLDEQLPEAHPVSLSTLAVHGLPPALLAQTGITAALWVRPGRDHEPRLLLAVHVKGKPAQAQAQAGGQLHVRVLACSPAAGTVASRAPAGAGAASGAAVAQRGPAAGTSGAAKKQEPQPASAQQQLTEEDEPEQGVGRHASSPQPAALGCLPWQPSTSDLAAAEGRQGHPAAAAFIDSRGTVVLDLAALGKAGSAQDGSGSASSGSSTGGGGARGADGSSAPVQLTGGGVGPGQGLCVQGDIKIQVGWQACMHACMVPSLLCTSLSALFYPCRAGLRMCHCQVPYSYPCLHDHDAPTLACACMQVFRGCTPPRSSAVFAGKSSLFLAWLSTQHLSDHAAHMPHALKPEKAAAAPGQEAHAQSASSSQGMGTSSSAAQAEGAEGAATRVKEAPAGAAGGDGSHEVVVAEGELDKVSKALKRARAKSRPGQVPLGLAITYRDLGQQ